jgi:hypothetical protein
MFSIFLGSGCATTSYGNQNLTPDKISQIKKGVTTKTEVVDLLGQPDTVGMMPDGRRMMMYSGMQGKYDDSQEMYQAVPIVGALVPEHTTQTMRRQSLQIMLDANDVVQDYEYSDNTAQQNSTLSAFGMHNEETTTSNVPSTDSSR